MRYICQAFSVIFLCHLCYPSLFRVHVVPVSREPEVRCIWHLSLQRFFFQVQPFPWVVSFPLIGQGSFRFQFPWFGTMTALRLLIAHPVRFSLYSQYCKTCSLFVSLFFSPLFLWSERTARSIYIPHSPSAVICLQRH